MGYITGHKGDSLRGIERDTNTFIFAAGSGKKKQETEGGDDAMAEETKAGEECQSLSMDEHSCAFYRGYCEVLAENPAYTSFTKRAFEKKCGWVKRLRKSGSSD